MGIEQWTLDLVDDDLDLPGWLFLPPDLDAAGRQQWLAACVSDLDGTPLWDEGVVTTELATQLLEEALAHRAEAESVAMLQVWPPLAGHTAMCHVNFFPSDGLPSWTEMEDAVVQPTDAPHLGPGLEVITSRKLTLDDGEVVDLTGVHFVFDDGELTVMVSLDETLTTLISIALPALVALIHNLRVVNAAEDTVFEAVAPAGLLVEGPWDFETSS